MDLKKLKTSELVMLGGAVLVFLGTFFKWFKSKGSINGISLGGYSVNGFHYFLQGTIPWLLAIALAAVIIIKAFVPNVKLPPAVGPLTWAQVYLIAGGLSVLLIFTRIVSLPGPSQVVGRGFGIFIALLGAIGMAAGAFMKFQAKEDSAPAGGGGTTPPTPF